MKERRIPNWFPLTFALASVLAVKLIVFLQLGGHPLLQPDAGLDTSAYVALAKRVLGGDVGLGPGLYYVSPLYIYFLAFVYGLTDSFEAVQVVQVVLGTATVWFVFMMGRSWGGARAGWIAAALAAGCGVFTFHEITLMQSALDPFLTACALGFMTMALRSAGAGVHWFFIAGACFGLQALNRPQVLAPAVVIILLLAALRRMKPAAVVFAGLTAALIPVAARNILVSGQWSLVSSHGGLNFYIGNHDGATGLYTLIPGIRPGIEGQQEDTRRVAEADLGRALSDSDVSDYFLERGWRWIRENPAAAAQLFGKKLILAVHADHVALPHSFEFFAHDARTPLRWLVLNPWIIVPLGIAGLLFTRPRTSPAEAPAFWLWAAFVPAYAVALAVFFVAERYRLPLLVPLCVTAGILVDRLLRAATGVERFSRTEWVRVIGGLMMIAIGVNWPFQLADSREGDRLRMLSHAANHHEIAEAERWASLLTSSPRASANVEERIGRILLVAGYPREAARHLKNALESGARGAELRVDLAEAQQRLGDASGALTTLGLPDWPDAPPAVYLRAGRLAGTLGAHDLSVGFFSRATAIDAALGDAWAQLGFALLLSGRTPEAEKALLEAVQLKPADAGALGALAVCAARLGRAEEARLRAAAALAIDPAEPLASQVRSALSRQ